MSLSLSSIGFYTDGANEWTQPWPRKELQSGGGQHCCLHRALSHSISHPFLTYSLIWTTMFFFSFIFYLPSFCLISAFCISFFLSISSFQSVSLPFCLFLSCAHILSQFSVSYSFFSFHLSLFWNRLQPFTNQHDRPINQPLVLRLLYSREHKHTSVYTQTHTCTLEPCRPLHKVIVAAWSKLH